MRRTLIIAGTLLVAILLVLGACAPTPALTPTPAPAPAAFSLSNLTIQPAEVQPKETVTITVSVANTGGTKGSYTVVLKLNGEKEAEKSVTIAAGSSEIVTFSVTREEASSYSVTVDGLSASFTVVAPAPTVETIEDTDSACVWEGDWEVQENPGASGGTWTAAPPSGQVATYDAKVTITFTGTGVALRYVTAPHAGGVSVSIDGVNYPDIDMYSADVEIQLKDIATELDNTEHVLVFQQLHERNSLSTGYVVVIDAIEVIRPE